MSSAAYTEIYNKVVPAIKAVQSTYPVHIVAPELSYYQQDYIEYFLHNAIIPPDAVSVHYYADDGTTASDYTIFCQVETLTTDPKCAGEKNQGLVLANVQTQLGMSSIPSWFDENNVDSIGYEQGIDDFRGTHYFFVAFRPNEFSELAKAGAR